MAKQYEAKLTLKDNFSAVLAKAVQATEQFRTKLEETQRKIDKIGKKKVQIGAKLDSSVNTTLSRLKGRLPKDKTIQIKAKDEVTRAVTNMQRSVFKLGRELNYGMKDPFAGFSRSAGSALRSLAALKAATASLATSAVMKQFAAGSVGSALAGGALAGRIASAGSGKTRFIPVTGLPRGRRRPDPDHHEARERYHRLARGEQAARFDRYNRRMIYFDSDRADMIARQKRVMRERYGRKNYLPGQRPADIHVGGGEHVWGLYKKLGKAGYGYQLAKQEIKLRIGAVTTSAEQAVRSFASRVKNSRLGEVAMRLKFAGERGLYALQGIRDRAINLRANLRDNGAMRTLSGLYSKASSLNGKTFSFAVRAITSGAQAAIGALMTSVRALAVAAGAITIGGAVTGIKGAANQEQNVIAIEHFVKYNNMKQVSLGQANPLSDEEIKKATASYLAMLRKYADQTPFATSDVMAAGRRAINIMSGSITDAEELVKIAGDIAALNPGKTIMDAMEALADLKVGEFERMKEFGLKISAKEFKALVGKGEGDVLTEEETLRAYRIVMQKKLKTMFGGGAKKMGGSAAGLLSTFLGTAQSSLSDIGAMFLPGIKVGLIKAIAWIENVAPRFTAAFKPIAEGFNALMTGGKFSGVFAGFAASVKPAIDAFTRLFKNIDIMKLFSDTVGAATAFIGACWSALAPVINVAGQIITDVMEWVGKEIGNVRFYFTELGKIVADIGPTIADILVTAWRTIKPALEALWNLAKIVANVFIMSWPLISGVIKTLWAVIKPIFQAIASFLQIIAEGAELAHRLLKGLIDFKNGIGGKVDINVNNNGNKFTPPPETELVNDDGHSDRAIGMNYIPYDGFKVNAHRGEAILTRTEADVWRAGGSSTSQITINIHDPVVREETDLDRLGTLIAGKLSQVRGNMGAIPAIA